MLNKVTQLFFGCSADTFKIQAALAIVLILALFGAAWIFGQVLYEVNPDLYKVIQNF